MIQAFGIGCTLLLLIALAIAVYKGVPILVASPICGALCLLCNGMPVMEGMKEAYIGEAAGFFKTWFLFFLAGAILGKIMERSGAAASIARFIIDKCGTGMAIPAVVIACGVLMMGGVSGKLGVRSGEGFYHYDHPETAGGKREEKITRMIQAINQVNEELGGYND